MNWGEIPPGSQESECRFGSVHAWDNEPQYAKGLMKIINVSVAITENASFEQTFEMLFWTAANHFPESEESDSEILCLQAPINHSPLRVYNNEHECWSNKTIPCSFFFSPLCCGLKLEGMNYKPSCICSQSEPKPPLCATRISATTVSKNPSQSLISASRISSLPRLMANWAWKCQRFARQMAHVLSPGPREPGITESHTRFPAQLPEQRGWDKWA